MRLKTNLYLSRDGLYQAMLNKGYRTVKELSEFSDVGYQTISNSINGRTSCSLRTIKKLADQLGCEPNLIYEIRKGKD